MAEALLPEFERESGHKVAVSFGPSNVLRDRILAGAGFDATVLTPALITELVTAGKVAPGSAVNLARAGLGLVVREGAPRPDISTAEGLRRALLGASSIVISAAGQSAIGFRRAIEGLGISAEILAKARLNPDGVNAGFVARGEAEMAVQLLPELMGVPGVTILGPFPAAVQSYVVLTAGLAPAAAEPARALVGFLAAPARQGVIREKGLEPG